MRNARKVGCRAPCPKLPPRFHATAAKLQTIKYPMQPVAAMPVAAPYRQQQLAAPVACACVNHLLGDAPHVPTEPSTHTGLQQRTAVGHQEEGWQRGRASFRSVDQAEGRWVEPNPPATPFGSNQAAAGALPAPAATAAAVVRDGWDTAWGREEEGRGREGGEPGCRHSDSGSSSRSSSSSGVRDASLGLRRARLWQHPSSSFSSSSSSSSRQVEGDRGASPRRGGESWQGASSQQVGFQRGAPLEAPSQRGSWSGLEGWREALVSPADPVASEAQWRRGRAPQGSERSGYDARFMPRRQQQQRWYSEQEQQQQPDQDGYTYSRQQQREQQQAGQNRYSYQQQQQQQPDTYPQQQQQPSQNRYTYPQQQQQPGQNRYSYPQQQQHEQNVEQLRDGPGRPGAVYEARLRSAYYTRGGDNNRGRGGGEAGRESKAEGWGRGGQRVGSASFYDDSQTTRSASSCTSASAITTSSSSSSSSRAPVSHRLRSAPGAGFRVSSRDQARVGVHSTSPDLHGSRPVAYREEGGEDSWQAMGVGGASTVPSWRPGHPVARRAGWQGSDSDLGGSDSDPPAHSYHSTSSIWDTSSQQQQQQQQHSSSSSSSSGMQRPIRSQAPSRSTRTQAQPTRTTPYTAMQPMQAMLPMEAEGGGGCAPDPGVADKLITSTQGPPNHPLLCRVPTQPVMPRPGLGERQGWGQPLLSRAAGRVRQLSAAPLVRWQQGEGAGAGTGGRVRRMAEGRHCGNRAAGLRGPPPPLTDGTLAEPSPGSSLESSWAGEALPAGMATNTEGPGQRAPGLVHHYKLLQQRKQQSLQPPASGPNRQAHDATATAASNSTATAAAAATGLDAAPGPALDAMLGRDPAAPPADPGSTPLPRPPASPSRRSSLRPTLQQLPPTSKPSPCRQTSRRFAPSSALDPTTHNARQTGRVFESSPSKTLSSPVYQQYANPDCLCKYDLLETQLPGEPAAWNCSCSSSKLDNTPQGKAASLPLRRTSSEGSRGQEASDSASSSSSSASSASSSSSSGQQDAVMATDPGLGESAQGLSGAEPSPLEPTVRQQQSSTSSSLDSGSSSNSNSLVPDSSSSSAGGSGEDGTVGASASSDGVGQAELQRRRALPILLFDLNGTLTSHTGRRKSAADNKLRPGLRFLRNLLPFCRLGIYTSASSYTVSLVLSMLEAEAGCPLFERQLVLHRAHTQPAPQHHMLGCGLEWQPYDTQKPLARWFARPERVLLFDDDQYKAVAGEEQHMVVVPSWGMDEPKACTVLQRLVEVTLKELAAAGPTSSLQPAAKAITESLASSQDKGRPSDQAVADLNDPSPAPSPTEPEPEPEEEKEEKEQEEEGEDSSHRSGRQPVGCLAAEPDVAVPQPTP